MIIIAPNTYIELARYVGLIIVIWIVVFVLIKNGLNEVERSIYRS